MPLTTALYITTLILVIFALAGTVVVWLGSRALDRMDLELTARDFPRSEELWRAHW